MPLDTREKINSSGDALVMRLESLVKCRNLPVWRRMIQVQKIYTRVVSGALAGSVPACVTLHLSSTVDYSIVINCGYIKVVHFCHHIKVASYGIT